MTSKSKVSVLVLAVAAVAAGLLFGFLGKRLVTHAQFQARKPVTITYIAETSRNGGSPVVSDGSYTEYVRSDGAMVHVPTRTEYSGATHPAIRQITIPKPDGSGVEMTYDPESNTVVTHAVTPVTMARLAGRQLPPSFASGDCEKMFPTPTQATCTKFDGAILGYPVMVLTYKNGPRNDNSVQEFIAPDLNWAVLKRVISKGTEFLTTLSASSVVVGDPAASLFHIPANAKVVPHSVFLTQSLALRGQRPCASCADASKDPLYNTVPPVF